MKHHHSVFGPLTFEKVTTRAGGAEEDEVFTRALCAPSLAKVREELVLGRFLRQHGTRPRVVIQARLCGEPPEAVLTPGLHCGVGVDAGFDLKLRVRMETTTTTTSAGGACASCTLFTFQLYVNKEVLLTAERSKHVKRIAETTPPLLFRLVCVGGGHEQDVAIDLREHQQCLASGIQHQDQCMSYVAPKFIIKVPGSGFIWSTPTRVKDSACRDIILCWM